MPTLRDSIIIDPKVDRRKASFFGFDIFIAPLLIKIFFILGSIACLLVGGFQIYQGLITVDQGPDSLIHYAEGAATAIGGIIALRLWCEFNIILFKIFEELRSRGV